VSHSFYLSSAILLVDWWRRLRKEKNLIEFSNGRDKVISWTIESHREWISIRIGFRNVVHMVGEGWHVKKWSAVRGFKSLGLLGEKRDRRRWVEYDQYVGKPGVLFMSEIVCMRSAKWKEKIDSGEFVKMSRWVIRWQAIGSWCNFRWIGPDRKMWVLVGLDSGMEGSFA